MTKSNFGKYFRYKLSRSKSSIVIFAILNFLSTILPCIMLLDYYNYVKTMIETNYFFTSTVFNDSYNFMKISAAICMIMITVTTVRSVRIYHDRAAMDTLGCLPLSYGERFWGDLLSGICANFISLVPFSVITVILTNAMKPLLKIILESDPLFSEMMEKTTMFSYLAFILMFVYIGIYAVTTFISSCCGKFGSSVLFSFVAMAVIPGIFMVYAEWYFSNVIGVDTYREIGSNIVMLPPLGPIFSILINTDTAINNIGYFIKQPYCIIVAVLIITAFIAGAYFIGKKRKTEKTGEGFVFKTVFYILSLTLLVMVIGVIFLNFFEENGIAGIFIVLPLSFLFYSALELSQNKNFKRFWKTVIRFAAVFGACFAFLMIVRATNSFNYYKKLPSENSIKEIRISGEYFYTEMYNKDREHIYKARDSVSAILSEHKKLLTSDDINTGDKLKITYVTKGGREIFREYSVKNGGEQIKDFSGEVKKLKEFDPSILGVLGKSDLSGITVFYDPKNSENYMISGVIRDDKKDELAEILRFDIENNFFNDNETGKNTVGYLEFNDDMGEKFNNTLGSYRILTVYKDTLKFLNDPDNYIDPGDGSSTSYDIWYMTYGMRGSLANMYISISGDDTSEYVKELLPYIEVKNSVDEYSPYIKISDNKGLEGYGVKLENENAAMRAILNLFREKYAQ